MAEEALLSLHMAPMMSTTSFAGRIWSLSCVQAGPCLKMLVSAVFTSFLFHPVLGPVFVFTPVVTNSKHRARLSVLLRDYTEVFTATNAFMRGERWLRIPTYWYF